MSTTTGPTQIKASVAPAAAISGRPYSITLQSDTPFTSPNNLQYSNQQSNNPPVYVGATGTVTLTVSTDGMEATFGGIVSGSTTPHTAYGRDTGNGCTSQGAAFTVIVDPNANPPPVVVTPPPGNNPPPAAGAHSLTLLGTYCNNNGSAWNPDSEQPNVQAWLAGRQNFAQTVGHAVNSGNIFGPASNSPGSLGGNLKWKLQKVNQVYTNPPYDYIPALGTKLFQVGDVSPATGKKYVWNDVQAYKDVAAGLWDASWVAIVDAMVAMNRTVWFQRVAYEGNCGFMQDFSGYNNQQASLVPWCAAMRRVFVTIKNRAQAVGALPLQGMNPSTTTQNDPTQETAFSAIGADCQNIVAVDTYNGYWGLNPNKCPADMSGKVAGVGPAAADLISTWNRQNGGWGFEHASALALKYKMPLTVLECGSSGGSHHMLDDPNFYPWLASAIKAHRAKGGQVILVNIWSVPAGDGNTGVQNGVQPTTAASLRRVINDLVGDTFDPSQVKWGGNTVIPPTTRPPDPPITLPPDPPVVNPPDPPVVKPPDPPAGHENWTLTGTHADGSPTGTVTLTVPAGTNVKMTGPTPKPA
jgi:hypothetical protein